VWLVPIVVSVLAVSCGVGGYVWLKPGEWVTTASAGYPEAVGSPPPGLVAALRAAPLVVDGRLRVFTNPHEVWAELLTAPDGRAPFWSYRQFPASVVGVVAVPAHGTDPPMVAAKWSNGNLIGIDARTGRVAWRATVELGIGDDYNNGGPTGVLTIYGDALLNLFTAETQHQRPTVISSGEHSADAFEPATGRRLWHLDLPGCTGKTWTGRTVFAVVLACNQPKTIHLYDAGTGREIRTWRPAPDTIAANDSWTRWVSGCTAGLSMCDGFHISGDGGTWRLHPDGSITTATPLRGTAVDTGDMALRLDEHRRTLRALSRSDGAEVWHLTFPNDVWRVAADRTNAYVITSHDELLRLDPRTGAVQTRVALPPGAAQSFHVYATDGYVVIDRSNFHWSDRDAEWTLPRSARPVLLVAT
jgi:outer membrane protein assembly factor BamB